MASSARRRVGGGPGGAQWMALGGAVLVILGLTFALGLLVGRQWARHSVTAVVAGVVEAAKKPAAAPRRSGIAAETMADRAPESTEKLTFYKTLTEPLDGPGSAPKPEAKPVAIRIPAATPSSLPPPVPAPPVAASPYPRRRPLSQSPFRPLPRSPPAARAQTARLRTARPQTPRPRTGGVRGPFRGPRIQTMPQRARLFRPSRTPSRSAPTRIAARPTTCGSSWPAPGWTRTWSPWPLRKGWPATGCGSAPTGPGRRRPRPPSGSARSAR